ncbi:unnamed protein product [Euphydryas editha]|uniref:Peptidase S1 domain-containing protein n=1 Tax=Euphydryas editha TaxID=104508 RepID=A0AAU9TI62_EUPED|nr:unnamed protein product [Euphydryas editha]
MTALAMFLNLFLILFLTKRTEASYDLQSRILYGENVTIEEYPFYAGLQISNNVSGDTLIRICGAAIISDMWILTAAHCVSGINSEANDSRSSVDVFVGGETFDNSIKFPYKKLMIHEGYHKEPNALVHDVAVIKLATPLQLSEKVRPVKLPMNPVTNSKLVFIGTLATHLQKVDLIRLPTQQCWIPPPERNFVDKDLFEKITICATREGDMPSICFGDSGSPLISDNTLIGLASYTKNELCSEVRNGYYMNVAYYAPWIKNITGL